MDSPPIEIEAKFIVAGFDPIRQRLNEVSALTIQARQQEVNLRFDLPDARLRESGRVLRLRQDDRAHLTFKAPGPDMEHRHELELVVEDGPRMQQILEALGYQVVFIYEKRRETFALGPAQVMLDELPFGHFVEIEGDRLDEVRQAGERLGLGWSERATLTYLGLFEALRRRHAWTFRDATFDNFRGLPPVGVEELRSAAGAL
jgi:adenylate cyclase class 2